jgi:hypothetical protein
MLLCTSGDIFLRSVAVDLHSVGVIAQVSVGSCVTRPSQPSFSLVLIPCDPSPCPTRYGGHLGTMITPSPYPLRDVGDPSVPPRTLVRGQVPHSSVPIPYGRASIGSFHQTGLRPDEHRAQETVPLPCGFEIPL